jgi:hypothetical protein
MRVPAWRTIFPEARGRFHMGAYATVALLPSHGQWSICNSTRLNLHFSKDPGKKCAETMTHLEWWTPNLWVLAIVSIAVAVFVFRRSRHPSLKIHKMWTECLGSYPDYGYHEYWRLDFVCLGADIFDLKAYLECDHSYWQRGRRQSLIRR